MGKVRKLEENRLVSESCAFIAWDGKRMQWLRRRMKLTNIHRPDQALVHTVNNDIYLLSFWVLIIWARQRSTTTPTSKTPFQFKRGADRQMIVRNTRAIPIYKIFWFHTIQEMSSLKKLIGVQKGNQLSLDHVWVYYTMPTVPAVTPVRLQRANGTFPSMRWPFESMIWYWEIIPIAAMAHLSHSAGIISSMNPWMWMNMSFIIRDGGTWDNCVWIITVGRKFYSRITQKMNCGGQRRKRIVSCSLGRWRKQSLSMEW